METQFIRLNMIPSGVIPIFNISQYDVGRALGVYVFCGIRNVNLDNYTVTVEATRSDGTAIIVGVTTNNNVGTFEVTPVMSNLANSYRAQLVITDENSRRIASLPFIINVIRAAMNENSEAIEEDATLYQQYTDAMQGIIAEVKADLVDEATERQSNIDAEVVARQSADNTLQSDIDAEMAARQSADNTLQSNINNETSARIQSDTTINARIDEIIAPSGEAPSAAEVTDARIGANGVTYASLGTAIRAQISNLDDAVERNNDVIYNIKSFNFLDLASESYPTGWRTGYYNETNPSGSSSSNYIRTIPESPIRLDDSVKFMHVKAPSGKYIMISEYDGNAYVTTYGEANASSANATSELYVKHTSNHTYKLSVGKFSGDGATYAADTSFIASITFEIYSSLLQESVDEVLDLLPYDNIPISSTFAENKYWNDESSVAELVSYTGNYLASNQIKIEPNHKYMVSVNAGYSLKSHPVIITDSDLNILWVSERPSTSDIPMNIEVVTGSTARYMLVTSYYDDTATIVSREPIPVEEKYNLLKGKTVAILGDSICTNGSTGENSNVPEITIEEEDIGVQLNAWLTYYDVQAGLSIGGHTFTSEEIGTKVTFTPTSSDVGKQIGKAANYNSNATKVWWEVAMDELGFNPIPVCWSGSSVTAHEDNIVQRKTSYAWHEAQIRKCGIRIAGTMTRIEPDVIIIHRGANDFSHEPYTLLTEGYFDDFNWQYPTTDEVAGGYGLKEGMCLTIKKLRDAYPNAKIFLCTYNVLKRVNYSHFPTNNGINSLPQYSDAVREIANFMGCGVIEFDKDGITFENCYSQGYITDSAETPTHPSDKGHRVMGLKAIADIKAQYSNMA